MPKKSEENQAAGEKHKENPAEANKPLPLGSLTPQDRSTFAFGIVAVILFSGFFFGYQKLFTALYTGNSEAVSVSGDSIDSGPNSTRGTSFEERYAIIEAKNEGQSSSYEMDEKMGIIEAKNAASAGRSGLTEEEKMRILMEKAN